MGRVSYECMYDEINLHKFMFQNNWGSGASRLVSKKSGLVVINTVQVYFEVWGYVDAYLIGDLLFGQANA